MERYTPSSAAAPEAGAELVRDAEMNVRGQRRRRKRNVARGPRMLRIWIWRLVVVAVIIVGWQWVPQIPGIRRYLGFLDPYFISSPSGIVHEIGILATGSQGITPVWAPLARTVLTALIGTGVACAAGACAGLIVSTWESLELVVRPFLIFLNAIPRIAIIPIIILIVGSSPEADALTALSVVFFLVFYNAYEGGASVPREVIQNAHLLGASSYATMWKVRWPYALAWTMASLPNAIAFGLVGAVTAEIFTGSSGGMGYDMSLAVDNVNSNFLFAIVAILAIVGVILVMGAGVCRRLLIPWWETSTGV
jgi:NitT/TauT family transport system permease protein